MDDHFKIRSVLVVKFHIVKLRSLNAVLSSPRCLTQGNTFFLSGVLRELETMCCGESLFNLAASASHIGDKVTPFALAENQSPLEVLPKLLPQIPQIL